MKRIISIVLISIVHFTAKGQILGGFFNQQDTKIKLMIQQIAGYQAYLHYLKSGYSLTQNGLSKVHELKNGTFTLHRDYFNSLENVAPSVRDNPKIKGITGLQRQIITTFDNAIWWQKDKAILSGDEISYMQKVYSSLLADCNTDLEELTLVVTDGKAQMSDQERIRKIDQLYSDMGQKYSFSRSFTGKAYALTNSRITEKANKQTVKKIYDLN